MRESSVFQDQVRQIGKLIAQFDEFPDGPQKIACKELLQLLLDVHGTGLERAMEIVFESGEAGSVIIDKLARDATVGSLLVLYSLHPDDLQTRVRTAVDKMRPRLRKLACGVDFLQLSEATARVQVTKPDHLCGSSAKEVRSIIEDGIYEIAPDVTAIEILGLDEPSSPGFVALESLMGTGLTKSAAHGHPLRANGME